jgi:lipopolysaccharide export system protein LptA
LLIIGLVLFGTAFGVYARFLGWIDGLPELPDEMLVRRAETEPLPPLTYTPAETKLQQAFGAECPEVTPAYSWKLKLRAEGMVLAFNEFKIDPEGRVRLSPFSLATFKEKQGQFPEINTVHADVANLEFDRPVKVINDIQERRIIGCQLESDPQALTNDPRRGRIVVVNNRATPSPDDDLVLETPGPLVYREAEQPNLPLDKTRPQLETAGVVHMVDHRGGPDSTVITAQGMRVFLNVEAEKPGPVKKAKSRGPAVTGVRRVVLPSNVDMNLWSDSNDGFLASPGKSTATQPADKPAERNHVRIMTPGQFVYDVLPDGDRARFDRLPPSATPLPNCVRVVRPVARTPGVELNDQLECDALELRFTAKSEMPQASGRPPVKTTSGPTDDRQSISWAHAWGQFIVLTSDSDKLEAHGNDLVYDAKTKATTLRGAPEMVALKEGNEIHAPELIMYSPDEKQGRNAEAHGAGFFRMLDQGGGKRTVEARWRDRMTYREEPGHNLLTLTGEARFEDRENHQTLQADLLKLWLTPEQKPLTAPPPTPAAAGAADQPPPKIHPQRVEATGRVAMQTPDMIGRDIEQLVLLFREAPPLPSPPAGAAPQQLIASPAPATQAPMAPTTPAGPVTAVPPPAVAAPPPKKPIDVRARALQAFIVRRGEVNEVDTVHCEDDVHVHQEPVSPQDRPTDMRGRTLKLKHTADGNILTVTGTIDQPGEVHLPDISLIGPTVVIDQVENVAEVQGLGSMRLISKTDFDGKTLAKPTPMTVTWKLGMRFTGKQAVFRGFVQADQENTTILCQSMQVDLNRPVSLNEQRGTTRAAGTEPATVDKVVCDAGPDRPQGAIITDTIRENGRLMSIRRLEQDEFALYKEEGRLDAANHGNGRGFVRIVQLGPKEESPLGPGKTPAKQPPARPVKPSEQEYKATIVRYKGPMRLNNQSRTAQFFEDVEVLHLPVESPDQQPQFDSTVNRLPTGVLYLRSDRMTVYSAKDAAGQTRQEMIATGKADVTVGDQFHGAADVIKYDESKQLVTLEGRAGAPARARRLGRGGTDAGEILGEKILYDRARDIINIERGYSATGH